MQCKGSSIIIYYSELTSRMRQSLGQRRQRNRWIPAFHHCELSHNYVLRIQWNAGMDTLHPNSCFYCFSIPTSRILKKNFFFLTSIHVHVGLGRGRGKTACSQEMSQVGPVEKDTSWSRHSSNQAAIASSTPLATTGRWYRWLSGSGT